MAKKYYSETQNRTPRPRSKRLRALGGGAASAGGATVVSVTGGSSEPSGDGHTHTNKPALDEISTDEERYLYLTKEDTPEDSEAAVFTKEKVKAGFADKSKESESAKEADHATKSDEALHADEANNAKKWDGHVFDDYLDQPVRTSDEVAFNGVRTEKVESASGFEEGLLGKGFQLQQKSDGKSRLEVDELLVRMKAYFASLEIRELSYVGGNYVFSSAGSRIYYVEKVADGWKCYFYSDDGTTSTMNYWKVGDQARCQTFNIEEGTHTSASNKYYWRKVTAVGSGRIEGKKNADGSDDLTEYKWAVLSDTDFDGDDVPEPDDRIVQMGSRNIESRQGLIYLVVEGENAPAIMEYSGVGAEYPYYVLPEPTLLLSPKKNIIHGEFHSVAYGGGGSGSINQQIQDLMNQLEEVKAQNDQKMDIWFYSHSPLPTNDNTSEVNAPASEWVTDEQKALHIHDLFYDTSRNAGSAGGRAWKWVFEDNHYFWAEVTDQDTLAALEKIADVASDGILTGGAEKSRVLVDWNACVSEYDKYVGQAEEFKKQKPEFVTVTLDAYKTAFIGLGTLLNGGAAWAVSDGVPSWLVNIQEDTTIPDPENYREAWAVYYSALSALLKAITDAAKALADDAQEAADDAQETADGAVDQLENMAADNIITLQEKLTLSHLWDNVKATHTELDAEAVKYAVAHTDYDKAFNAISTLVEKILASTTDYTLTTSDGYTTKWSAYYTQESALYAAIVTAAKKVADDAQKTAEDAQNTAEHRMQFFASQPTPPYNVGDMWLDSSIIKVCTKARTKSETFHSEDWKQFTDYSSVQDPRILLAAFANAYYNSYKDKLQQSGNVNIFINTAANDSPAGSIKYDAQGGSIFMCSSGTNSWVRPTSISNGTTIATTIDALYNCMGAVTLTVYSNVPATGMKQYDIVIRTVSYYDHFKKENISGKCEILMYNGTCWEVLQESVTSIIDNLGDQLRLIVFGSNGTNEVDSSGLITRTTFNELFSQKVTTDANGLITNINKSGLLTENDFVTLYSEAIKNDGTIVKRSEISAFVTKDANGYLQSGVKIKADNIELEGVVSANKNFKIDQYGNLIAVNATVTGTLNVKSGKIGGFWVSGTGLTNQNQDPDDEDNYGKFNNDAYIIFRNDNHNCFAGIGGNILPASSGARGVARFENEDESDQWGFGRNYALLVSAKNGSQNDAIYISGGCITRLAVKTQSITSSGNTINAGTGSVVFLNTSSINTYLPDVFHYDDGHIIKMKNVNGKNVNIYPGTSEYLVKASTLSWYDKGIAVTYYDSSYYKAAILTNKNPVKVQIVLPDGYTLYVQQWKTNDESKTLSSLTSSDGLIKNETYTGKGTKTIYCDAECGTVVIMLFKSYNTITSYEASNVIGTIKVTFNAYISADRSDVYTKSNPDNLESAGDAAEYVYHSEVFVQKDNKYYKGCWVQYKHPRDW